MLHAYITEGITSTLMNIPAAFKLSFLSHLTPDLTALISQTLCKNHTQHQSLWNKEDKDRNITSERVVAIFCQQTISKIYGKMFEGFLDPLS